jgi:hypothetical protein
VSETIAAKVRDVAEHEGRELTSGTTAFIEDHRVRESANLAAVVTTRIWLLIFHGSTPTYPKTRGSWPQCSKPATLLPGDHGRIR